MRSLAFALLLLVAASPWARPAAAQGARFRIYEPRSRTAEELAPLVAPLLGPGGAAVPDPQGGKLILEGEPGAVRAALAALASLDAPLHQYRIESELRSRESLRGAFAQADAWVDRGALRVGRIAAGAGSGEAARGLAANVVVLEGRTAELWTGTSQVVRDPRGTLLVPAQSGFRVRPRSLGSGEIELEITPVVADAGRGGEIHETSAATQIRVRPGEAVALAGLSDASEESGAGLPARAGTRSDAADSVFVVRVTPLDSAPAAPAR